MRQSAAIKTANDEVCLSDVLGAVSTEVDDLLSAADRLQALVGEMMSKSTVVLDIEMMMEAQTLDAMVQRLSALSEFLQALRPAVPDAWVIDPTTAAQGLSLADSARRFACRVEEHAHGEPSSGDFDLF